MTEVTLVIGDLLPKIRSLIAAARGAVERSVNILQVLTNFEIGRLIVEHEQEGTERAAYGKALLKKLAASLTEEFGRGFSRSNLAELAERSARSGARLLPRTASIHRVQFNQGPGASGRPAYDHVDLVPVSDS